MANTGTTATMTVNAALADTDADVSRTRRIKNPASGSGLPPKSS
jgi:hypothetical protein